MEKRSHLKMNQEQDNLRTTLLSQKGVFLITCRYHQQIKVVLKTLILIKAKMEKKKISIIANKLKVMRLA